MRRRVLLFGPHGQLGHDVRRAHAQSGDPFDLDPIPRETLNLTAPGSIERFLGGLRFDALLNCAAYTQVDLAEDDATGAFAVNLHAVQAMARVCAARRARLLHVSTDYVFGGDAARRQPLREDDPTAPVNVYGASKAMGEMRARLESDDVVVLRTASLFGVAGAGGKGENVVETMIRAARETGRLRAVDDQTTSPTATADVARVAVRMLTDGCAPGTYHVVNTGSATWFEFACELVRRAGVAAEVVPRASEDCPARAPRPRYSALDNAKVAAAFGAMPTWQDALERYLRATQRRAR
ncbi:MAG: dTDP-4-dehydrorhamnose reductase [Rhodospirillales bacterium]|nr:dTDP-4-dehydrorhamnose reductase [Rhodospirillales bacterium]